MAEKNNESPFVIERTYEAPTDKVWYALTNKDAMKKWYFNLPEFRPEVNFAFEFYGGPPEKQYLHKCKITEVIPGKKLSHTWRYDGYSGDSLVTFELFPEGNKTRVKLTHSGLDSFAANNNTDFDKKNFAAGWTSIIGKSLKEFVESEDTSDREIIISRLLNAPRELVWEAWTDRKHLEKWWGPDGFTTATSEFAFHEGGDWIFAMIGPDGRIFPNEITFEKIVRPELITYIHGGGDDVGVTDAAFHATITFEDKGGKTLVTMKSVFKTAKQRTHVVEKYGAIEGGKQHLANLEEYVLTKLA